MESLDRLEQKKDSIINILHNLDEPDTFDSFVNIANDATANEIYNQLLSKNRDTITKIISKIGKDNSQLSSINRFKTTDKYDASDDLHKELDRVTTKIKKISDDT